MTLEAPGEGETKTALNHILYLFDRWILAQTGKQKNTSGV